MEKEVQRVSNDSRKSFESSPNKYQKQGEKIVKYIKPQEKTKEKFQETEQNQFKDWMDARYIIIARLGNEAHQLEYVS